MRKLAFCLVSVVLASSLPASDELIWDDRPGVSWEKSRYPLGNGRLGCMIDGCTETMRLQFNVDSLWTGDKNLTADVHDNRADPNYETMGSYQNFGELEIAFDGISPQATEYRRALDLSTAVYRDSYRFGEKTMRRVAFASAVEDAIIVILRPSSPCNVHLRLRDAHGGCTGSGPVVAFSGRLENGLAYAARADLLDGDGPTEKIVVLRAVTGADADGLAASGPKVAPSGTMLARHVADYRGYYDRMTFELGAPDLSVPTRERLARVREGKDDPSLIALLFNYGRYLLISCSRPGTLPANLQGIWNDSNRPAWHCDYHVNINLQMNYWGADAANLSDCFTPLSDWMLKTMPVAIEGTRAAFPESKGFAYRTSANAVGGGGWRWNFAGAPWLAAQCYDHWLFTRDRKFLREVYCPIAEQAAEFILSTQLKERPDGTVVVRDGWSPEHGPREDGVAHDQQIVREFFRGIIGAARELKLDTPLVREVARLEPKLLKDKVGSWGQLQEWETDRDVKGDQHRHTSHLYAVYPGSSISRTKTPELAAAAKVALAGRTTTGDARRSWTWPWRTAIWARLGEGDKAGEMMMNLLRYNTMDNMFTTHPPFQIDGNLGTVGAVCEILLERAIPSTWPHGRVKGLRTREGKTVGFEW